MNQRAVLNAVLDIYPYVAALVRRIPKWEQILVDAWQLGAETLEIHPLIDLLIGESSNRRLYDLEKGLAALRLADDVVSDFARRIVVGTISEHRDSAAALTELYVGGRLALVQALVSFIPRQAKKTPDIRAVRNGVSVTLEIASGNVSDQDRDQDIEDAKIFQAWPRGTVRPLLRRGEVSEHHGGALRFLQKSVSPFGGGDLGKIVGRLASKKSDEQLKDWPNPVLVRSFWHMFGVSRHWCNENIGTAAAPQTGLLYAATYGYEGDPIFEGETFDGEPISYYSQAGDGILVKSSIVSSVVWLFQKDLPVLFESPVVDLAEEVRMLLLDAFKLRNDTISRVRSPLRPTREEIAVAAYYRWQIHRGMRHSDLSLDDWLRSERQLQLTSPGQI